MAWVWRNGRATPGLALGGRPGRRRAGSSRAEGRRHGPGRRALARHARVGRRVEALLLPAAGEDYVASRWSSHFRMARFVSSGFSCWIQ